MKRCDHEIPLQEVGRQEFFIETTDHRPTALSGLNFGVEVFQFVACVVDRELPVDAALLGSGLFRPSAELRLKCIQFCGREYIDSSCNSIHIRRR